MALPNPKTSLDNSCSVIWENTLFSYTSGAFQSIRLEEGAKWKTLEMGERVTGATCVGTSTGFFVVGGKGGSTGMQKYTYSDGKWAAITLGGDPITKNRQWHSSAYILAFDSIMVYAGTRDGSRGPGTETFIIQAHEPYGVQSHDAAASPAIKPILLPLPPADTLMVAEDGKVWWFNPTSKWRDSRASLAEPIKDTSSIQAALIQGKDGSQNLLLFDLSQSPNMVTRVVIQDGKGVPVLNSPPITQRSLDPALPRGKRQSTEGDWPKYNSTFAPTTIRENYGIAQDSNGLIVLTGGDSSEPIAMFDAFENSWLNATDFFAQKSLKANSVSSTSSTSSSKPTSTTTVSSISSITSATQTPQTTVVSTPAAGALASKWDGLSANTVLGITLGSIFGFLILIGALLLLLRRRKNRRNLVESSQSRRDGAISTNEKSAVRFGKTPPMESPGSPGFNCRGRGSYESFSSVAILMGKVSQQEPELSRIGSHDNGRSLTGTYNANLKSNISKPILQGQDEKGGAFQPTVAEPRSRPRDGPVEEEDGPRRSSGWNKYWSGGSALGVLGFGGKRNTVNSNHSSHYSQSSIRIADVRQKSDSATVPPLNFDGRYDNRQTLQTLNSVPSGSPVVTGYPDNGPFHEGMAGKIERPISRASSGYTSGIPESINEMWHPTTMTAASKPWGTERAPSHAYVSSFALGTANVPLPASGVSTQPQLAMAAKSSDMSWLNLGEQSRDSRV